MDKITKILPVALILLLSFFAIRPLLINGYFPMHDDTQPARIYEMGRSLRDGQFPVRWVADLGYGYGYPIFNFYAPLPYYFASLGVLGNFGLLASTKLMFGMGVLLSAISMYFLGKKIWGAWSGFLSACFYVYIPYHAVQIYVRGAVGEYWAYGLLPLGVLGILETKNNWKRGLLIGSIGFAGVVLSHNIIAMLFTGILCFWLLVEIIKKILKQDHFIWGILVVLTLGIGLTAFFWLPVVAEANLTKIYTLIQGSNDFREHFVYLDQLWDSPWGFAGSAPGRTDGMSFKIGKIHLIFAFAAVSLSIFKFINQRKNAQWRKIMILFLGLVISIFMMLPVSKSIWEIVPFLAYIQYPWRLLVFTSFFTSLLVGGVITYFEPEKSESMLEKVKSKLGRFLNKDAQGSKGEWVKVIALSGSALLVIGINAKYFQPKYISNWDTANYSSPRALQWEISQISNEYLPKDFPIPQNIQEVASEKLRVADDIIVKSAEYKSHFWKVNISAQKRAEIVFNIAFFPGWEVVLDTQKVKPSIKDGLISIEVPKGDHIITLYFGNTWVRRIGNWVSFGAAILLMIMILRNKSAKKTI